MNQHNTNHNTMVVLMVVLAAIVMFAIGGLVSFAYFAS